VIERISQFTQEFNFPETRAIRTSFLLFLRYLLDQLRNRVLRYMLQELSRGVSPLVADGAARYHYSAPALGNAGRIVYISPEVVA